MLNTATVSGSGKPSDQTKVRTEQGIISLVCSVFSKQDGIGLSQALVLTNTWTDFCYALNL